MDIVFNELSVKEEAGEQQVVEWFDVLLENLKKIQKITKKPASIVSCINIKDIQFSNYSVMQWLKRQNKEDKQKFLSLTTKKPFILDYPYYYFEQIPCKGFAYAYENKELSTSLISSQKWNTTQVNISKEYLDENECVIEETDLKINHFSKSEHLNELETLIILKVIGEFENELNKIDGNTLWEKHETLFPSLIFCDDTRIQLSYFSRNDDSFQQIKRKLFELENYFANWGGVFDFRKLPFKVTKESDSRNNKLEEALSIKCPDGQYRLFDWHFRFTPSSGRGYFFPDSNINKCYIGFIGKKINKK